MPICVGPSDSFWLPSSVVFPAAFHTCTTHISHTFKREQDRGMRARTVGKHISCHTSGLIDLNNRDFYFLPCKEYMLHSNCKNKIRIILGICWFLDTTIYGSFRFADRL